MKFVAISCLCAGALAAVGCADGRLPTSPSATSAVSGLAATAAGTEITARQTEITALQAVLLLTKTCDAIDHCAVITSSSGPIPVGSDIDYFGPLLEARTTSRILVTTPAGDTAGGNCSVSYKTGEGICVITDGTGALAGLHANLRVSSDFSSDPAGVFTWEGRYHFER
jgi:hypothetical protein